MRTPAFALIIPFLWTGALHGQSTTPVALSDPDHIDLRLAEVTVALPIAHWEMVDGAANPKVTPIANVTLSFDSKAHTLLIKGPPDSVKALVDRLRFFDRPDGAVAIKTHKLEHADPAATAQLLNAVFSPYNGPSPGATQVLAISGVDGKSVILSGEEPGLDSAAALLARLDTALPANTAATTEPAKMLFQFTDATVDDILDAMEQKFSIIILRPENGLKTKVTVNVPDSITQDQSIKLLNSFLTPIAYQALESRSAAPNSRTVLRVQAYEGGRRIPIFYGVDPEKVATTDNLVTQVIPLSHAKAVDIKKELESLASPDADIAVNTASNFIVITDTSAKIHGYLEKLQRLDK